MKWDRIRNHLETAINILKPRKKLHITEKKHVMAFTESNPKCYSISRKGASVMYDAINLAKYIVNKCNTDCHPISNLQLQKILYFIQKEFLQTNRKAFQDPIEAWQFGPVVPSAYYHFCGFGAMPITTKYDNIRIEDKDLSTINRIIEEKRNLYPWDLVGETHRAGGAWDQIYQNGQGNHKLIPTELIKEVG